MIGHDKVGSIIRDKVGFNHGLIVFSFLELKQRNIPRYLRLIERRIAAAMR